MKRVEYERMLRKVWDRYLRERRTSAWLERALDAVNKAHDKPNKRNLKKVEPYVSEAPEQQLDQAPARSPKGPRVRGQRGVEPLADGAPGH